MSTAEAEPTRATVQDAMRRASDFMLNTVSHQGGFVWYYLPDLSRRWGELEARPSMLWMQPPGTATVGHVLLDAWYASGDGYFYEAAARVADAVLAAQHPSGGWNYLHDFAGEETLREWYATVGANAWRLEEFHHYLGNATFDDGGTSEASLLLLRMLAAGGEERYRAGFQRALDFVLTSQYPSGGWPQRYPPVTPNPIPYTDYITLNDDVVAGNIRLLLLAYRFSARADLKTAALRGMEAVLDLQLPAPQPGWALQYSDDLKPAAARSYEPASLSPAATARAIEALLKFCQLTGDRRFLAAVPAPLAWLEALALPAAQVIDGRTHPRVVELETNRALYIHRRGSNVVNGEYSLNYSPEATVTHYPSTGYIDTGDLRHRYQKLLQQLTAGAEPTLEQTQELALPRYYISERTLGRIKGSAVRLRDDEPVSGQRAAEIIASLRDPGYWPSSVYRTTHEYRGPGPAVPVAGDYRRSLVGDWSDTSPFLLDKPFPVLAIDIYIANMARLSRYLESLDPAHSIQ